jgi:hypothetical protein
MNKQKQRIAIAEGLGWTVINDTLCHITPDKDGLPQIAWIARLPDYLNDLNAMQEVERAMNNNDWWKFVEYLTNICGGGIALGVSATAAQRAEAFLRTIGKWEE